jgi:sRNA-binding carbon storage regulator CsrA
MIGKDVSLDLIEVEDNREKVGIVVASSEI